MMTDLTHMEHWIDETIAGFPSNYSKENYACQLKKFFEWAGCCPEVPTHQLLNAYLAHLIKQGYKFSTVNFIMSVVRKYAKLRLWRSNKLEWLDIQEFVHAVPYVSLPAGRALSTVELDKLMAVCSSNSKHDIRDMAVVAVLYGSGVRRFELCNLKRSDLVGDALSVHMGKGAKSRLIYLPDWVVDLVKRWLAVRSDNSLYMFVVMRVPSVPLSVRTLGKIVFRLSDHAQIDKVTCHDFRRTYATNLLDAGVPLDTVAALLGHANLKTTKIYDRRDDKVKRLAVSSLYKPSFNIS